MVRNSDQIPTEHYFDVSFEVRIPQLLESDDGITWSEETLLFYTDGSKTDEGVEIGINGPDLSYFEPLGRGTSIFHVEVAK